MVRLLIIILSGTAFGFTPAITSFNSGQVSPLMEARANFERYSSSCRTLENMIVTAMGPVLKRPGTKYIATTKEGSPRLLPFEYSTDDTYILETGNLYMRFYRDGGQILQGEGQPPVEIVTPYATGGFFDIQTAQTENSLYLVDGTNPPQVLSRTSHTDWTIQNVAFETGPFLQENETDTTITPSGITGSIELTASSSVFQSTSEASHVGSIWSIEQIRASSTVTGFFDENETSLSSPFFTGSYSFATTNNADGTITLQRSTNNGISWRAALVALTDLNFDNPAETEEDGAIYRVIMSDYGSGTPTYTLTITDNVNKGVVKITSVSSGTSAVATVITDLVDTSATTTWREGYWSDYRGWPTAVSFYQQRLVYGGSSFHPQTLWFGKQDPDDYANFREGTLDTSAFTVALEGQNPIKWMLARDFLLIGTSGSCGKWGSQGEIVTPTSPSYQEQTRHGSASIGALMAGDEAVYIERGARKVRQFGFSFQTDKYESPNLSVISPEITDSGIVDIAFQLRPDPVLWCVLNNGEIATLTYQSEQAVIAWTKQITDGDFGSVAVISSGDAEDEVWVTVERTIEGNAVSYIEQFQPNDWGDDQEDAFFVDSGFSDDITPTTTTSVSDLDWLEGETVKVWADGIVLSDETVVGGEITIDVASSVVTVGLPYTAKLETMPIRIDPQDMSANKKIKRLWVDFYKTGACSYGNGPNSSLTDVNFWQEATLTAKQDFHTSTVRLKPFSFVYSSMIKQTVYFESSEPVPLGIRSISPEIDMGQR